MFRTIGVLRLEFHRQVFSTLLADHLKDIQHLDFLGYKDVIALPSEPHPVVVRFADETVPAFLEEYRQRWTAHRDVVAEFADTRGLASKLSHQRREQLSAAFLQEVRVADLGH